MIRDMHFTCIMHTGYPLLCYPIEYNYIKYCISDTCKYKYIEYK